MPETTSNKTESRRKILIGVVTSTKMTKTIVVEVVRQKAHPLYQRVVSRTKKFYAHDEDQAAHVGDFVRIEETRPLSRLKRWKLQEVVKRSALTADTAKEVKSEA
jgi:small subunit ribosomal protein S17